MSQNLSSCVYFHHTIPSITILGIALFNCILFAIAQVSRFHHDSIKFCFLILVHACAQIINDHLQIF